MSIVYTPVPTGIADHLRKGKPDSYGLLPETQVSDGGSNPCRHCLKMIPEGEPFLVVAHRPFDTLNPYTETGPIFLCKTPCERPSDLTAKPETMNSPTYIVRGYDRNERIVYGTGSVIATPDIPERAAALFRDESIAFIHVRSASNNCFHVRIDRSGMPSD